MKLPSAILQSPLNDFKGKGHKLKSSAFFLLLLSVLFLPLSIELPISKTMRLQFPLELLAPATVALILAGLLFFRNEFRFLFTDFAVLLFIAVAGMSVVSSVLPITSIKSFSVLTTYVITFYFAFRFLQLKKSHWQIIWQALLVGYSALLLYTLFRYFNMGIHRKHSYEMSLPFVPGHTAHCNRISCFSLRYKSIVGKNTKQTPSHLCATFCVCHCNFLLPHLLGNAFTLYFCFCLLSF